MNPQINCARCGSANQPSNTFCGGCGGRLLIKAQAKPETGMSPGRLLAILSAVSGLLISIMLIAFFALGGVDSRGPAALAATASPDAKTGIQPLTDISKAEVPTPAYYLREAKQYLARGTAEYNYNQALSLLRGVPITAPEYKEAQGLIRETEPRLAKLKQAQELAEAKVKQARLPELRETLKNSYLASVERNNPHLNYIGAKLTKINGGYALWATHEFFTQYTFSAGSEAREVNAWIDANRTELNEAGIIRVGVMGRGGFASSSWFDLKR